MSLPGGKILPIRWEDGCTGEAQVRKHAEKKYTEHGTRELVQVLFFVLKNTANTDCSLGFPSCSFFIMKV